MSKALNLLKLKTTYEFVEIRSITWFPDYFTAVIYCKNNIYRDPGIFNITFFLGMLSTQRFNVLYKNEEYVERFIKTMWCYMVRGALPYKKTYAFVQMNRFRFLLYRSPSEVYIKNAKLASR